MTTPVSALVSPGAPAPIAATRPSGKMCVLQQLLRAFTDLPDDAFSITHIRGRRGCTRNNLSISVESATRRFVPPISTTEQMGRLCHIVMSAVIMR